MAFIKLVWFEQNVWAETKLMLWSRMVLAEDASSSRGCSFHPCLPACLSGAVLCKGKQREEEGVEHLGRNKARSMEKMSQARQPSCWRRNQVQTESSESCETWKPDDVNVINDILKAWIPASRITIMSHLQRVSTSFHQYDDYQTSMCTSSPIVGGLFFICLFCISLDDLCDVYPSWLDSPSVK